MTDINASELIQLFTSLKNEEAGRDWGAIFQDEAQFENLQEKLDDLIGFAAMANPGVDLRETENFVGKVAIAKVKLSEMTELDNGQNAVKAIGSALEADIKKMLFTSPLIKKLFEFLKNNTQSQDVLSKLSKDPQLELGLMFVLASLPVLIGGDDTCCDDDEQCEDEA